MKGERYVTTLRSGINETKTVIETIGFVDKLHDTVKKMENISQYSNVVTKRLLNLLLVQTKRYQNMKVGIL